MRTLFLIIAMLASVVAPAWGNQCPRQISALDEKMRQHGSMLSPDKMAQVKKLRDKAEQAHKAGNHDEAMQAVEQAQSVMGIM